MYKDTLVTAISCHDNNLCIGKNNQLLFHIRDDLQRFKSKTLNKCVIMGHNTFKSRSTPLPNRYNIVLTRNPIPEVRHENVVSSNINLDMNHENVVLSKDTTSYTNVVFCNSITEAMDKAIEYYDDNGIKGYENRQIMILGGEPIYKSFIPYYDIMELTWVMDGKSMASSGLNSEEFENDMEEYARFPVYDYFYSATGQVFKYTNKHIELSMSDSEWEYKCSDRMRDNKYSFYYLSFFKYNILDKLKIHNENSN